MASPQPHAAPMVGNLPGEGHLWLVGTDTYGPALIRPQLPTAQPRRRRWELIMPAAQPDPGARIETQPSSALSSQRAASPETIFGFSLFAERKRPHVVQATPGYVGGGIGPIFARTAAPSAASSLDLTI